MYTISEWWMWIAFLSFVLVMIVVDLFLLGGKKAHPISIKEALAWFIVWVSLALVFNVLLWWYLHHTIDPGLAAQKALEFFTGYLIEESLSIDNLFVFLTIFHYFAVPKAYQRRVLLLGLLGAIILRLLMILLGVLLVQKLHWILLVFGIFLIFTGIKMLLLSDKKPDFNQNILIQYLRRHLDITTEFHQDKFMIIKQGKRLFTPLFIVLVLIEMSDLIFAIDSIPAIFAITQDPFIIFTSNIFAILGLRALYFLLSHLSERFHLLKYGISIILMLIGTKMIIGSWYSIPIGITLGVIISILFLSALLSVFKKSH